MIYENRKSGKKNFGILDKKINDVKIDISNLTRLSSCIKHNDTCYLVPAFKNGVPIKTNEIPGVQAYEVQSHDTTFGCINQESIKHLINNGSTNFKISKTDKMCKKELSILGFDLKYECDGPIYTIRKN